MPSRPSHSWTTKVPWLLLLLAGCVWQRTPVAAPAAGQPIALTAIATERAFEAQPTPTASQQAQPPQILTPSATVLVPTLAPTLAPSSQRAYFSTLKLADSGGASHPVDVGYLLYLPRGYGQEPRRTWPLILYLHGSEERGEDPDQVRRNGLPKLLDQGTELPAIVLSPQCPVGVRWWQNTAALGAVLDLVQSSYAVDSARVYVTGWSMGAYGTWALALGYPRRFAALAPIAGGCDFRDDSIPESLCQLRDVPVWVFHGAQDRVIAPSESENAVRAMQACGADVRFTLYPEADHDGAWELAYTDQAFCLWLLQQARL